MKRYICLDFLRVFFQLTKADMYALGLSGGPNSEARRKELSLLLDIPDNLSANALLEAICLLITKEEFDRAVAALSQADT